MCLVCLHFFLCILIPTMPHCSVCYFHCQIDCRERIKKTNKFILTFLDDQSRRANNVDGQKFSRTHMHFHLFILFYSLSHFEAFNGETSRDDSFDTFSLLALIWTNNKRTDATVKLIQSTWRRTWAKHTHTRIA